MSPPTPPSTPKMLSMYHQQQSAAQISPASFWAPGSLNNTFGATTLSPQLGVQLGNNMSNNNTSGMGSGSDSDTEPYAESATSELSRGAMELDWTPPTVRTTDFDGDFGGTRFGDGTGFTSPATSKFGLGELGERTGTAADYSLFLMKYSSYTECGMSQCRIEGSREHFHCRHSDVCAGSPLSKKEQITRHLKWHQKRSDSLSHGFLRFSSTDDCAPQFPDCSHNRKQTHYHCLQPNCDKVYISTSDVQMHSNYHRKDSAIIQEGFQRFRATEECNAEYCIFYRQRTTHFHCRRNNCQFTFKNKADMEKHKSYHIKDEQLNRDGFKKFLKTEECNYKDCKYSRNCNHIHCIRENCNYVLHSSGQLYSHKRKHERKDQEMSYRRQQLPEIDISAESFSASLLYGQTQRARALGKVVLSTGTEISVMPTDLSVNHRISEPIPAPLPDISIRACSGSPSLQTNPEDSIQASVIRRVDAASNGPGESFTTFLQNHVTDRCTSNPEPNLGTIQNGTTLLDCYISREVRHVHCLVPECPAQRYQQVIPRTFDDVFDHYRCHFAVDDLVLENNLMGYNAKDGGDGFMKGAMAGANKFYEIYNDIMNSQPKLTSLIISKQFPDFDNSEENSDEEGKIVIKVPRKVRHKDQKPQRESNDVCKSCCKLKKKNHYHCDICNQAFVDQRHLQNHHQEHDKPERVPTPVPELPTKNSTSSEDSSVKKEEPQVHIEIQETTQKNEKPAEEPENLAQIPITENGHTPSSMKAEEIIPEDLTKNCTVPKTAIDPQPPVFDQNLADYLNYQRMQYYLQNYYQFVNQQMLTQPPTLRPEFPYLPDPQPLALDSTVINNSQPLKRNSIEADNQEVAPNFKKIKLRKFSDLADTSSNGSSFNEFRPITSTPNIVESSPILNQKLISSNFPMVSHLMNQDIHGPVKTGPKNNRMFKDEPVPKGYLKFKFNEDCNFLNCGYRNHQSHFHCIRNDCCYSFCDKTRFVQHSARHERLDKLMGGDFKQFRANMSCGYTDCEYNKNIGPNNKSSHFHCQICDFICSDTNKVVAHRRQHNKMNQIKSAGFEKFTPGMDCTRGAAARDGGAPNDGDHQEAAGSATRQDGGCVHNQKQTHYHCLVCNYAVLGLAQMSAHKFRHMD